MDIVICIGRISRCLERKYIRRFGKRTIEIQNCGKFFDKYQERVQRGR